MHSEVGALIGELDVVWKLPSTEFIDWVFKNFLGTICFIVGLRVWLFIIIYIVNFDFCIPFTCFFARFVGLLFGKKS